MKQRRQSLGRRPVVRILIIGIFEVIGLLLWPILSGILLPFAVFTAGLFFLVLNGVILWLASLFVDGFEVDTLGTAIIASLGITAINIILSTLFTIDDDASWYRNVVRRRMRKRGEIIETDVPGVLFLEIDGLATPVLQKALADGYAPTMKRWIDEGNHKLIHWETDLSSQTSASQAGILHGTNRDIPAFRWYDRQRKIIVASSNPDEVARLEQERSDGNGLLSDDGASRGNLLSGDAPNVMATASVIKDRSRFHTADFYAYFANPYNFSRTLLLFFWDIVLERWRFRQDRRNNVQPRLDKHHRNFKYALVRGVTTTILRELNIYTLIGDMFAGRPSAYATFVGYDEVAHHSGVESMDAFDALHKIDQQFARLESAKEQASRPYHFVILSDHGQSGGATFQQRYGLSLDELVQQLADEYEVQGYEESGEGMGHINVMLTDAMQNENSATTRRVSKRLKRYTEEEEPLKEGQSASPPAPGSRDEAGEDAGEEKDKDGDELPGIVVMASGNLGLVYGTQLGRRVTLEEMEDYFPGMLEGLASHEGVGFVMVGSPDQGAVVIGPNGRYYLGDDRVEGENPLTPFGPRAAEHLRREDSFPNCPDLLINSFYHAESNEVAAFEELIGCHGGMGGYQTQPFLLYPAEWPLDDEEIVGAGSVYRQLKGWLADVKQNGNGTGESK